MQGPPGQPPHPQPPRGPPSSSNGPPTQSPYQFSASQQPGNVLSAPRPPQSQPSVVRPPLQQLQQLKLHPTAPSSIPSQRPAPPSNSAPAPTVDGAGFAGSAATAPQRPLPGPPPPRPSASFGKTSGPGSAVPSSTRPLPHQAPPQQPLAGASGAYQAPSPRQSPATAAPSGVLRTLPRSRPPGPIEHARPVARPPVHPQPTFPGNSNIDTARSSALPSHLSGAPASLSLSSAAASSSAPSPSNTAYGARPPPPTLTGGAAASPSSLSHPQPAPPSAIPYGMPPSRPIPRPAGALAPPATRPAIIQSSSSRSAAAAAAAPPAAGSFPGARPLHPHPSAPAGVPFGVPPRTMGPALSLGTIPTSPLAGPPGAQPQGPPLSPGVNGTYPTAVGPPPLSFGGPPPPPSYPQQQNDRQHPQHHAAPPLPAMPQAPGTSSAAGGRSIDPGQMPHPLPSPPPTQVFETRRENTHNIPPPAAAPIVVRDTGSAGPRYMRCSLNTVPQSNDLLKSAAVPFVVVINPLALREPNDSDLDIVDPGDLGPMRCSECKAYVCPYMRWGEGGRRMQCCFCGAATDVPPEYFSHLDLDGGRRDKEERPELRKGSVEFIVRGAYQVRPPMPPTFYFLIEVTAGAISSGATACVCASLAQLLEELPGGDLARVCIATFDSRVHFYELRSKGGAPPRMLVMSDVDEPFSAAGARTTVPALANLDALKALLLSIPGMFAGSQAGESAGGAALHAAVQSLKNGVGGRLMIFLSSLPHKGALALRPREAGRPPSEKEALDVMVPEGKAYAALAADAAEHQVSLDVFALGQGYVDLATLTTLTAETSGCAHRYTPFNPSADSARFHNDLRWALLRPQGLEAVARLRVSRGLAVDNYVGAFHRRNPTDLHFPAVSCDHSIAAKLVHEERLPEGGEAYLQYALLYSAVDGTRRVRVHTLALPITRSLGTVFRGADLESYLSYVARKVSGQLAGRTLVACKEVVVRAVVDTLAAYRRHCASASSTGQLILPESLKLLPLYALGLTKLPCFRTDARADSRAVWASRLLSLPADRIVPTVYPRLLKLHSLPNRPPNAPIVPERLWLTAEKVESDGAYLLENGFDAFLYVGPAVPQDVCLSLLGLPSVDAVELAQWAGPPSLDTPLSKAVASVLGEVRRQCRAYMHLRLVRRGAPHEAAFFAGLVEDRAPSTGMSYVEFLCHLHRQIQNKLNG